MWVLLDPEKAVLKVEGFIFSRIDANSSKRYRFLSIDPGDTEDTEILEDKGWEYSDWTDYLDIDDTEDKAGGRLNLAAILGS